MISSSAFLGSIPNTSVVHYLQKEIYRGNSFNRSQTMTTYLTFSISQVLERIFDVGRLDGVHDDAADAHKHLGKLEDVPEGGDVLSEALLRLIHTYIV